MSRRTVVVVVLAVAELVSLSTCGFRQAAATTWIVAGYAVPEDARGVAAIDKGALTEISPVWCQPTESGQIIYTVGQTEQSSSGIEAQALSHQVAVLPSISNFRNGEWDGALIHRIITNPQVRAAHIRAIVDMVRARQWAGIDLDYESLDAADRAAYSAFVGELSASLHQAQKRLTLTVHAKTAEPGDWSGARAQDWRALGGSADEVRVMAYDYSTEDSSPGAIAPLLWVKSVLQLAISEIPRDKIVLGVATYGYDWTSGQRGKDVQWTDAEALAQAYDAPVMWDPASQSPWFAYTDSQGHSHTVWYEDARSLAAKIDLAVRNRIGGLTIWRLGGEDPAIWKQFHQTESA